MPCTGKAIAANAAVVSCFISCLSVTGKSNNHISRFYFFVADYFILRPAAGHGAVYGNGTHHITHIGSFATQVMNVYAKTF